MKPTHDDKLPVRCAKECGYTGYRNQSTWKDRPCPRCGQPVQLKTRILPADQLPPALPPCEYREREGCSGWWVSYFQAPNRRRSQESLSEMRNDALTVEAWATARAKGARLIVVGEYTMPALRNILLGEAGDTTRALADAVAAETGGS